MKQSAISLVLASASTLALACATRADTVLVGEQKELPDGQSREASVYLAPAGVRMVSMGVGQANASKDDYLIFRQDKRLVWLVQPSASRYTQMDEQMVAGVGQQISSAMGMLQAQLATMPPEQRAQVEGMMKGLGASLGGGHPNAKPLVQKVASGEKVGPWTCDRYASRMPEGRLLQETWVAPADAGTIPAEDAASLRAMGAFFDDLSKGIQDAMQGMMPGFNMPASGDIFKGLPVRFISYDAAGKPDSQWELKSVRKEPIPADKFEVPAGFSQQTLAPTGKGTGIPAGLLPGGQR